jgi:hypothetical protein
VAEDTARLEKLAAFPFELRGTLDTKPARTCDPADFRSLAPRLLNQDSGLTEKGESMKELLERVCGGGGAKDADCSRPDESETCARCSQAAKLS